MLVRLGASGLAVMTDMPGYAKSCPNDRSGTKNEDKEQNSHRGEDNKRWWVSPREAEALPRMWNG